MTVKASEIVEDSLTDIIVAGAEAPIEAVDARLAIRYLNDMVFQWDASGITTGFTKVSDLGDTITVPDGIIRTVKSNLSVELLSAFNKAIPQSLALKAQDSFNNMLIQLVNLPHAAFPGTLPLGAGNECITRRRFFPDPDDAQTLTEQSGSILLEDDTE